MTQAWGNFPSWTYYARSGPPLQGITVTGGPDITGADMGSKERKQPIYGPRMAVRVAETFWAHRSTVYTILEPASNVNGLLPES